LSFCILGLIVYRGSDQGQTYVFPIPYFIYRGQRIDAENTSVKGALYEAEHFRLGLSMMGSLPVSSSKNRARQGMPALDPTFEFGLVGIYDFTAGPETKNYPSLGLALRSSYAVNFWRASHVGYFSVPFLSYTFLPQKYTGQSFIQASLSLMSADRSYHGYFYDVDPKYAKPGRPAYKAKGGYSGWHTSFYISKQSPPFSLYAFFRYDHLNGAAFADSPLVKTKDYFAGGVGLIWYLFQSETRASERLREK
jgi:outer membrane scaffolding protein for murein synthesis (MipA/OmpV family)